MQPEHRHSVIYFSIMRCYFKFIIILGISFILTIFFFGTDLALKPLSQVRATIFSKPWTLSARNNERIMRLYKKYDSILNLTAFKTNDLSDKTMIYSCRSFCGGWGDRLRGILSVYILALLTNRRFMIDMNYPCDIFKVVQPNFVNWTYIRHNKSKNRTQLTINTMSSWQVAHRSQIANLVKSKDFVNVWSKYDDIYISTNSDYMILALRNNHVLNETRRLLGKMPISHASMQTLFALLFELLFIPAAAVRQRVDLILSASYYRRLICLHIRIGKNPTNPFDHAFTARINTTQAMLHFTDNYLRNKSAALIFVTSDSGKDVSNVLHHYPNSSMTIVGPILHVDRFDRRSPTICDGFIKVLADFYLLGECQTSLLSHSGFSSWANRRRNIPNQELYLYDEKANNMRKN
jgi:hypothetical protein